MDILNYNYDANSNVAAADPAPPSSTLTVYSVSYPMLAKSVSKAGPESPTGNSTNKLVVSRDSNNIMDYDLDVEIAEGFPSTSTLINSINKAIAETFSTAANPLRLVQEGDSQIRWVNDDIYDWIVHYENLETKQLIRGEYEGSLSETIALASKSDVFECDSRLGVSQLVLKLTNGQSISVSSEGKWLDHLLFSFNLPILVDFSANREVRVIAHYNSLRVTKELYCPRRDGIIISTN